MLDIVNETISFANIVFEKSNLFFLGWGVRTDKLEKVTCMASRSCVECRDLHVRDLRCLMMLQELTFSLLSHCHRKWTVLHDCADFFEKQHVMISFIDIHVCWNDFLFLCQLPLHRNPEVQDDSTAMQMQAWWLHGNMIDVAVNWTFLYPSDGLHVMSRDCQFHVAYIQPCAMASLQLVKTKHVSESCVGSAWPCSHSSAAGWARSWTFFHAHVGSRCVSKSWQSRMKHCVITNAWNMLHRSYSHESWCIWTRNTHLLYSFIDLI